MLWLPDILMFAKFRDNKMFKGVCDVLQVIDEYEITAPMSELIYKQISPYIFKDIEEMIKKNQMLEAIMYVNLKLYHFHSYLKYRIWKYVIHIIIDIQYQRDLMNQLLTVVRKAMTYNHPKVIKQSQISWRYLVKNFTSNENVLLSPRAISLLIEPTHSL